MKNPDQKAMAPKGAVTSLARRWSPLRSRGIGSGSPAQMKAQTAIDNCGKPIPIIAEKTKQVKGAGYHGK